MQVEEEGEEEAGDGDGERGHRGRRKCYLLWHKRKRERGRHEERLGGWRDETSGGEEGLPSFTSSASFVTDFFPFIFGSAIGTWKSFSLAGQDRHELRKGNMLEPCLCVARVESD